MARSMRKGTTSRPDQGIFAVMIFSKQRPLPLLALCAVIGVLIGRAMPYRPMICVLGVLLGALLCPMLFCLNRRVLPGLMIAVFFLFAGITGMKSHPILPAEGNYIVSAVVADAPDVRDEDHVRVYLKDVALTDEAGMIIRQSGAYWTYYLSEDMQTIPNAGQRVHFAASLYHPRGQVNPYGYYQKTALLNKGIGVGLYGADGLKTADEALAPSTAALYARQAIAARLDLLLGEHSALPKALLLGLREDLPEDTRTAFAKAGIAHVLAVSGLHVGLLAAFLSVITRRLLRPRAQVCAIGAVLLLYCLMLDFASGVFRASVLVFTALFMRARGRPTDALSTLSLALLAVLFLRPLDLFTNGFLLSFAAALGLALLRAPFERVFSFIHIRRIRKDCATTFAATTGTLVPASFAFHRLSPLGLLASPAICLVIGALIPAYILLLLLSVLSLDVALFFAPLLKWATGALERVCLWLGRLPYASIRVPDIPWPLIPAFLFAVWFASPYCAVGMKRRMAICLAAFAIGAGAHGAMVDHGVTYTQLSMGNADCAVLFDDRETVVIDTGECAIDLTRWLLATGRDIDALVLTHLHIDHAGGVEDILDEEINIGRIYLPEDAERAATDEKCLKLLEAVKAKGVPISYLAAGDAFSTRRAAFTACWPLPDTAREGADANSRALTLLMQTGGAAFYLASDLSGAFDRYAAQKCDVLKVSHHGGSNETTEAFLSVARPSAAIVSTSGRTPRDAVLARLRAIEADAYSTADSAVVIRVSAGKLAIQTPYQEER